MLKIALAKMLSVKVAAAAIGVAVAGGGVALAASTGVVPTAGLGTGDAASHAPAHATGEPTAVPSQDAQNGAAPSPSLVGLCLAYAAGAGDNPGRALENPAFGALITAAGDKEKVAGYCAAALQEESSATSAAEPGEAATGKPQDPSAARPTPIATPSHPDRLQPTGVPATPGTH